VERASEKAPGRRTVTPAQAIDKAQAALDKVEQEHAKRAPSSRPRSKLRKVIASRKSPLDKEKERLEAALRRARVKLLSCTAPVLLIRRNILGR